MYCVAGFGVSIASMLANAAGRQAEIGGNSLLLAVRVSDLQWRPVLEETASTGWLYDSHEEMNGYQWRYALFT